MTRLFDISNLFSNQLSGTIPSTIGSLTTLKELYDRQYDLLADYEVFSLIFTPDTTLTLVDILNTTEP